jgi:hypothetical protein
LAPGMNPDSSSLLKWLLEIWTGGGIKGET